MSSTTTITTESTTTTPLPPSSTMRCRRRHQRPLRCPYREHTFTNILRLSATLICACATVSLAFVGCRVEEPSPVVNWVFTNLPYPFPSPLSLPATATNTPLFRYTSLGIWFLSSLTLLVFAHGISLLYPRRFVLPSVLTSCVIGCFATSGLLDALLGTLAGWGQVLLLEVTWREMGVLVVPWCVVLGLCVGMLVAGCYRRWGTEGGVAVAARAKDVEAAGTEVVFLVLGEKS